MRRLQKARFDKGIGPLRASSLVILVLFSALMLLRIFIVVTMGPEEACQFLTAAVAEGKTYADLERLILILLATFVVASLVVERAIIQSALQILLIAAYLIGFEGWVAASSNDRTALGERLVDWSYAKNADYIETENLWLTEDGELGSFPQRVATSCGVLPPEPRRRSRRRAPN